MASCGSPSSFAHTPTASFSCPAAHETTTIRIHTDRASDESMQICYCMMLHAQHFHPCIIALKVHEPQNRAEWRHEFVQMHPGRPQWSTPEKLANLRTYIGPLSGQKARRLP